MYALDLEGRSRRSRLNNFPSNQPCREGQRLLPWSAEPLTAVTDSPEDVARPEPVPEVALHLNAAKMLPFQFEFA